MIFYFTATGNCLYAAQQLQQHLGGELYSIAPLLREEQLDFTAAPGEYVGFVFPVYFWGIPHILDWFASRLRLSGAVPERTFIVATMGSKSGTACEQLERRLASRGIRAGYRFGIPMVSNYVPEFTMPSPEETDCKLNTADTLLEEAISVLLQGQTGDYNRHKGPVPSLVSPIAYRFYPTKTKYFYADSSCIRCGLCRRVCPVGAIRLENGSPAWIKPRCETCLACLHRCPAGAIQRGKDQRHRGRYCNPRVKLPAENGE